MRVWGAGVRRRGIEREIDRRRWTAIEEGGATRHHGGQRLPLWRYRGSRQSNRRWRWRVEEVEWSLGGRGGEEDANHEEDDVVEPAPPALPSHVAALPSTKRVKYELTYMLFL